MKNIIRTITAIMAFAALCSCTGRPGTAKFDTVYYAPEYADGFEILGAKDSMSRVVRVKAAWQGADSVATDLFISRNGENPPQGFRGQVINGEAKRIVAMSSSYIAMLELLKETDRIKGVSGLNFITNEHIRSRRDSIADVGNETGADFEKLAALSPDLVMLYGISASSAMESRLRSLGIPYIYMGEYLEPDPLGRAEWIVAVAEITGCREVGETIFRNIEERYEYLKGMVSDTLAKPKVMLNTPYGDTWYMASRGTAMAAMIEDAGAEYVYKANGSNKSMPVDMEEAYILASDANYWLNVGQFTSLRELTNSYPKFADVKSVREGNVYNCNRRISPEGGNDFWESGQVRPDLVLADLINIFHAGLTRNDSLTYYRKLE